MNSNKASSHETHSSGAASSQALLSLDTADILRALRRLWWLCILLTVLSAGVFALRSYMRYSPQYRASATFTVQTQRVGTSSSGISSYTFYYDRSTASQLEATFPSIIQSNILIDMIKNDLGVRGLGAYLSAESVSGTNMFTITATGSNPETVYQVLQSAIRNYPVVAEYIIGSVVLNILTEPVLPTSPYNTPVYRSQMLKGALVGLVLSAGCILLYVMFRQTVKTKQDVQTRLNQRCLAALPEVVFKKHNLQLDSKLLLTNKRTGDGFHESVRALRNAILSRLGENSKIVMLTSTAPCEGKTTIAANLALSLANTGRSVLLVDADVRNPSVNALFGKELPTFSSDDPNKINVTHHSDLGLSILNFNTSSKKFWSILKVEYLRKLFDRLRESYDYIVVDTAPSGLTSDPAIVAQVSDAAVFVVMQDVVRVPRIAAAIDSLLSTQCRLLGVVLNGADSLFSGYGHYGKYGHYGHYGKYGYGYGYGHSKDSQSAPEPDMPAVSGESEQESPDAQSDS